MNFCGKVCPFKTLTHDNDVWWTQEYCSLIEIQEYSSNAAILSTSNLLASKSLGSFFFIVSRWQKSSKALVLHSSSHLMHVVDTKLIGWSTIWMESIFKISFGPTKLHFHNSTYKKKKKKERKRKQREIWNCYSSFPCSWQNLSEWQRPGPSTLHEAAPLMAKFS